MILFSVAAVMVILVGVVAGVIVGKRAGGESGDRDVAGPTAVEISEDDLTGLVAARERALAAGDLQSFLVPLDQSNRILVDGQRRLFANLRKLPFSVKHYQSLGREGRAIDRFGRGVKLQISVAFIHQLKGYDVTPVTERYRWSVSRQNASSPLVITDVAGAPAGDAAAKSYHYPAPWDLWPDLQVVRTERVLFLSNAAMLATTQQFAPTAQTAADNVLAAWRSGGQQGTVIDRFVVSLLAHPQDLGSLYQISTKKVTEVGFTVGIPNADPRGGGPLLGGAREVFDASEDSFRPGNIGAAAEVFRHEFTHAMVTSLDATESFAGVGLQEWVVEGFAEYVANRGRSTAGDRVDDGRQALRAGAEVALPNAFTWGIDAHIRGDARGFHYYLAHQAMRYIATRYGEDKVFAFVAAHYHGTAVEQCFTTVLGTTQPAFERDWAAYVRRETR